MNFETADHEATFLRTRIRGDRSLRSNPTNRYHLDYQSACNRFLITYLFGMYLVAAFSYGGLSGLLGGILSVCLSALVVVAFLCALFVTGDAIFAFWRWLTGSTNHGGNY